jgi:glutathione S-transferase
VPVESPTVADICLVTQVTPAMTFNLSLDPYPRVMRVYATCMAIPAFEAKANCTSWLPAGQDQSGPPSAHFGI